MKNRESKIEELLLECRAKNSYKNIQLAIQRAHISSVNKELILIRKSTSWRITFPLRKVMELFRRYRG